MKKTIILIDNYDSFTFNIHQIIKSQINKNDDLFVFRNDKVSLNQLILLNPTHLISSPGPGI